MMWQEMWWFPSTAEITSKTSFNILPLYLAKKHVESKSGSDKNYETDITDDLQSSSLLKDVLVTICGPHGMSHYHLSQLDFSGWV